MALWEHNTTPNREALRSRILTLDSTKVQYTTGVPASDFPSIDPVAYTYDYLQNLRTPAQQEIQLDLLYDYRTNADLYPEFHAYFRKSQVPLLAVWGKGDPAFIPAGANAFKNDLPHAKVEFVDAGHFALETKVGEIAREVVAFLKR